MAGSRWFARACSRLPPKANQLPEQFKVPLGLLDVNWEGVWQWGPVRDPVEPRAYRLKQRGKAEALVELDSDWSSVRFKFSTWDKFGDSVLVGKESGCGETKPESSSSWTLWESHHCDLSLLSSLSNIDTSAPTPLLQDEHIVSCLYSNTWLTIQYEKW